MNQEIALESAVDEVAALLHGQIGLRPEPTLRGRLRRSIRDEATAGGQDPQVYVGTLLADREALQRLLNRVTVQETSFFRHPEHFDVLARVILPKLPEPVQIWSAGCANGQEAYSIAMLLEESGVAGSVTATDLSTAALTRTAAARYKAKELSGLSPARVARHLTGSGDSWHITPSLRKRVSTLRHNLIDPLPPDVHPCHVVFCRNVLIYFSPEHTGGFLDRLATMLPGDGYLFLGSAEAMWPLSERFDTVNLDGTFVYQPRADAVAAPSQVTPNEERPRTRARRPPSAAPEARRRPATTPRRTPRPAPVPAPPTAPGSTVEASAQELARVGELALAANDAAAAVVAFRKWAYLTPDDAMAHLHLGLAFEAAGDPTSAHRAFGAARRAVLGVPQGQAEHAIDGYAPQELLRMLDAKNVRSSE